MQAKVLVDTRNLSHEEWLEYRRRGIGGSDVAGVADIVPWSSPVEVWLDKRGEIGPKDDNEAMRIGRDLEDYVAQRFAEKRSQDLGRVVKVHNVNQILQHPEYKFMLANLDRKVSGEHSLLECKTTVDYWNEITFDNFPNYYNAQIQHYLAVTGYEKAYLAVLSLNKRLFHYYEVPRDEDIIKDLIDIETEFWNDYVLTGRRPPISGSKHDSGLINKLYPEAAEGRIANLNKDIKNLIEKQHEYKEVEEKYKTLKKEQENKIKEMMGEAEVGIYQGEELVRWKNVQSTRFNAKSFKEAHPDLYKKYAYESQYRRLYL